MSIVRPLGEQRLGRLVEVGRSLTAELDVDALLERVLEAATDLTDARYAAIGILDADRRQLARFITRGIDEGVHQAIGDLPRGRGVLGVLIDDPRPLRLANVGEHPRSYGFPPAHPRMRSFLGVPILLRGQVWGNLYLTEKLDGEPFTEEDEEATVILADWAAIAIHNARLYHDATVRRDELERAVRALEATTAIARVIGAETNLDRVLELVVKRGRALLSARAMIVLLRDGDVLRVAASAGDVAEPEGDGIPVADPRVAELLAGHRAWRSDAAAWGLPFSRGALGVPGDCGALVLPLVDRGTTIGLLSAFGRVGTDTSFTGEDELLAEPFAIQAATAIAGARNAEAERLRRSLQAAEAERRRWARELHDETLQALGGLKILLSSASRTDDPEPMRTAMHHAVDQLAGDIDSLRALIAELRPAALDELGLGPAITSLSQRTASSSGLDVRVALELPGDPGADLATTVYRLVQEALTNVVKHANASRVEVTVAQVGGALDVIVADDGIGIGAPGGGEGFGLIGMRERAALAGGDLAVAEGPRPDGGTVVRARLPLG